MVCATGGAYDIALLCNYSDRRCNSIGRKSTSITSCSPVGYDVKLTSNFGRPCIEFTSRRCASHENRLYNTQLHTHHAAHIYIYIYIINIPGDTYICIRTHTYVHQTCISHAYNTYVLAPERIYIYIYIYISYHI